MKSTKVWILTWIVWHCYRFAALARETRLVSNLPSGVASFPDVAVCIAVSSFFQVTVSPALMVSSFGTKNSGLLLTENLLPWKLSSHWLHPELVQNDCLCLEKQHHTIYLNKNVVTPIPRDFFIQICFRSCSDSKTE